MPLQPKHKSGKPVNKQQERYKCEHDGCLKAFGTKTGLNKHGLSHTQSRPHKCAWPKCSKGFNQRSALNIHWNTHTKAEAYRCGICPRSFRDPAPRSRHRKKQHGEIVVCICHRCDARIKRVDHFFTHLQKRHGTDWWSLSPEQYPAQVMMVYQGKAPPPMPYSFLKAEDDILHQSAPSPDASDSAWNTSSLGDWMLNSASTVSTHRWSQVSSLVEYGPDPYTQAGGASGLLPGYASQSSGWSQATTLSTPMEGRDYSARPQLYHDTYRLIQQQPSSYGSTWNIGAGTDWLLSQGI
ncbi:hypothetical protein JB92DRAFT_354560 [Gautieria morchelliformis]|nr:hypothetical protein JB92DRAFT_354560 [Gautieria morchelliformis]